MQRATAHVLSAFTFHMNMKSYPKLVSHEEEIISNDRMSIASTSHDIDKRTHRISVCTYDCEFFLKLQLTPNNVLQQYTLVWKVIQSNT